MHAQSLSFAACLLLVACGQPEMDTQTIAIDVSDVFVMEPLGDRNVTMGGATIAVRGGDIKLIAAEAAFAESIELHTVKMADGRMQMRQVESYDIEDGGVLTLKRGGDHFMVFGADGLTGGTNQVLTLVFELPGGMRDEVEVDAEIRVLGE